MIQKVTQRIIETNIHRDIAVTVTIGAVSATLDILALNLSYRVFHTNLYIAIMFGFLAGTAFGYPVNNYWTYRRHNQQANLVALGKCAVVGGMGLLFTELIMHLLTGKIGYNYNLSKFVAIFIVFFWNFFANRLWTFRYVEKNS